MLLLADDMPLINPRLASDLQDYSFKVARAKTFEAAVSMMRDRPLFGIVDLRFAGGRGFDVLRLLTQHPDARVVIFSAYLNLQSTIAAMRLGAHDVMVKPSTAEELANALFARPGMQALPPDVTYSADRVRWDHINEIFQGNGRNVSQTARQLGMHRRTLQRILYKCAPR